MARKRTRDAEAQQDNDPTVDKMDEDSSSDDEVRGAIALQTRVRDRLY